MVFLSDCYPSWVAFWSDLFVADFMDFNTTKINNQVIQAVTFLSPTWRSPTTFERVTFSPSQNGHKELPGMLFYVWDRLEIQNAKILRGSTNIATIGKSTMNKDSYIFPIGKKVNIGTSNLAMFVAWLGGKHWIQKSPPQKENTRRIILRKLLGQPHIESLTVGSYNPNSKRAVLKD